MKDNLVGKTLTLNAGHLSPGFGSATGMILCESFHHTQNGKNKRIASKSEQYYKQMINRYIGLQSLKIFIQFLILQRKLGLFNLRTANYL